MVSYLRCYGNLELKKEKPGQIDRAFPFSQLTRYLI
jgi:hypothetical protein